MKKQALRKVKDGATQQAATQAEGVGESVKTAETPPVTEPTEDQTVQTETVPTQENMGEAKQEGQGTMDQQAMPDPHAAQGDQTMRRHPNPNHPSNRKFPADHPFNKGNDPRPEHPLGSNAAEFDKGQQKEHSEWERKKPDTDTPATAEKVRQPQQFQAPEQQPRVPQMAKEQPKFVRVATTKNHTMSVGGVTYNFVKGKEQSVPQNVKAILAKANLLKAL